MYKTAPAVEQIARLGPGLRQCGQREKQANGGVGQTASGNMKAGLGL
jgi:hypothetical protein